MASGLVLMLAGVAGLFMLVVQQSAPLLLAFAAFGASLAGLALALIGLGRRLSRR
jgi:hypothetical protein